MDLTPTAYKATLDIKGKKITASLVSNSAGTFEIAADSFHSDSSSELSVWDISEFVKVLCSEHGEKIAGKFSTVRINFKKFTCTFSIKDVVQQSTSEVLQNFTQSLPFRSFID